MLTEQTFAEIRRFAWHVEDVTERLAIVAALDSDESLRVLLEHYNWDDGFVIPTAIAEHPKCGWATAQELFVSSDAERFAAGGAAAHGSAEWGAFCELLISNIQSGRYGEQPD